MFGDTDTNAARARRAHAGLAAVVLAAGCATPPGTPEVDPPAVIAADVSEEPSRVTATLVDAAWWTVIGGADLDALVATLLAQNLDLDAARARLVQAEALAKQAGAARLPQVSADAGAGSSRRIGVTGEADWSDVYSVGLSGSWDTDIFGGRRASARSARLSADAADLNARALSQSLIAALASAYIDAWALERQIAIAQALADSFDNTAELTDQRYRDGSQSASALDVLITRQNAAAARASVPELTALLTLQLQAIDLLIGRRPGETPPSISVSLAAGAAPVPPAPAPADLFRNRPDVAAAELSYRAALLDVGAAQAARLPSLQLTGSASRQTDDVADLFDLDDVVASLTAGLIAPIFQGGRLKAEVERAEARARELSNTFGQAALSALADVERARALFAAAQDEITLRETSLEAAILADRLAQERYATGQLSLLSVLETRRSLDSANRDLLTAQQDALNAAVDFALAAGGAWGEPVGEPTHARDNGAAP